MHIRPSGVLVQDQNLLTMCYHYAGRERFNLPGGNLEPGEELTACLMREFAEELDLEIAVGELLLCAETVAGERHVLHLVFRVLPMAGTPCLNTAQTRAVRLQWLPLQMLAETSLYPGLAPELASRLSGQRPAGSIYLGRLQQEWFT
ncbi:MAG: NUDIX domain-containing protein [Magnetococcales bacterium]|nr:NUDIX domain-containing protein [Magnetococcales bacterium]